MCLDPFVRGAQTPALTFSLFLLQRVARHEPPHRSNRSADRFPGRALTSLVSCHPSSCPELFPPARQIPMILEALKREPGLQLFTSPWSPPAWMKVGIFFRFLALFAFFLLVVLSIRRVVRQRGVYAVVLERWRFFFCFSACCCSCLLSIEAIRVVAFCRCRRSCCGAICFVGFVGEAARAVAAVVVVVVSISKKIDLDLDPSTTTTYLVSSALPSGGRKKRQPSLQEAQGSARVLCCVRSSKKSHNMGIPAAAEAAAMTSMAD